MIVDIPLQMFQTCIVLMFYSVIASDVFDNKITLPVWQFTKGSREPQNDHSNFRLQMFDKQNSGETVFLGCILFGFRQMRM